MCPILKVGQLPSAVDETIFLKEVDVALHGIGAPPVPRDASVADAAGWCLDRLSDALLERPPRLPRPPAAMRANPPLTGVMAPVDVDAVGADPRCTAEYFSGVLRRWGIGGGGPGTVRAEVADAVRHLDVGPGGVRCLAGRARSTDEVLDWAVQYLPFSLLSGEIGLLFAFTATPGRAGADG